MLLVHFVWYFLISGCSLLAHAGLISFNYPEPPAPRKPIPGGAPLYQCDIEERQLLEIQNVQLVPNPPVRGANLTIIASGAVYEEITEGAYVDVEVRLGYIKLLTQTFDLCEVLEDNDVEGLQCPIKPGQYSLKKEVEIPAEVPPGKYIVNARAYTDSDDMITCITGEITFPPLSFP